MFLSDSLIMYVSLLFFLMFSFHFWSLIEGVIDGSFPRTGLIASYGFVLFSGGWTQMMVLCDLLEKIY